MSKRNSAQYRRSVRVTSAICCIRLNVIKPNVSKHSSHLQGLISSYDLSFGGNAFDAAVSAVFTSMTSEFALTGLGGGGSMMVKTKYSDPILYDFFVNCFTIYIIYVYLFIIIIKISYICYVYIFINIEFIYINYFIK